MVEQLSPTKQKQARTAARRIVREMEPAGIDAASPPVDVAEWILERTYDAASSTLGATFQDTDRGQDLFSDFRTEIERNIREIAGDWASVDPAPAKRGKITDDVWVWIRAKDAAGVPRAEIARRLDGEFGVSISPTWLYKVLGKKRTVEGKTDTRVYATQTAIERARKVADALGLVATGGTAAGEGSLSALIQAIGDGTVRVVPIDQVRAAEHAIRNMVEIVESEHAGDDDRGVRAVERIKTSGRDGLRALNGPA